MNRRLTLALSALALLATAPAVRAQAGLDIPALVDRLQPSVVQLKTFDASGSSLGTGSGFFGPDGRIVTNAHVVRGAARVEAFNTAGQLLGTTQYAEALSTSVDLAILPRIGGAYPGIQLAGEMPRVGEPVVVIGSPLGFSNTVSNGLVSGMRQYEGRNLLQISAPISPGSSGGPVLNAAGQLIGVSVSVMEGGQNINFAVPASDVRALVGSPPGRYAFGSAFQGDSGRSAGSASTVGSEATVSLSYAQTLTGDLTPGDRGGARSSESYADAYVFSGQRGDRIRVAVVSDEIDPIFGLGIDGQTLVTDDDGGGGNNSLVEFTLPRTGEYNIIVLSARGRETGVYAISLARIGSGQAHAAPRSAPSSSRWAEGGSTERYVQEIDRNTIRVIGGGVIEVFVRATYHTPYTDRSGDTYDNTMSRYQYNCRTQRMRLMEFSQHLGSQLVYRSPSSSGSTSDWITAPPESVGEINIQTACRLAGIR